MQFLYHHERLHYIILKNRFYENERFYLMVVNNKQKSLYTRTCLANKKHIIKISHESKLSFFLYFKFCFFKLCCVFDIPEIKKNGNVLQGFLHSNKLTEVPNTSDDIRLNIPLIRTVL